MKPLRQAVILVGGKGSRLGALTAQLPKPMLPVVGELSMLDLLIDNVARHGYERILLLAGHLGERVIARYDGRSVRQARLQVLQEPEPRGTAGALEFALDHLDHEFLLMNGDSVFDFNLRELELALDGDLVGALALRHVGDAARFGTVALEGGRVTAFHEKTGQAAPALINGGVYALKREILQQIRATPCSLESDIFPSLAAANRLAGVPFQGYFIDIGLPETLAQGRLELQAMRERSIAFLDRDGVLNVDDGWPHRPERLAWIVGAREGVRLLNQLGFYVIVVSNQAGVAKGLYDEAQIGVFNAALADGLALAGGHVDAFYYSPHHPDAVVEAYRMDSPDRKPRPGMLMRAFAEWPARKAGSFMVGDKQSDVEAARAAGLPGYLFEGGALDEFLGRIPEVVALRHETRGEMP